MKSRRQLFLSGWVVLSLALIGLTVSCIFPESGRGGGWRGGGGGWRGGGGGWHEGGRGWRD